MSGEVADFQSEARTAGVQTAVQDQGTADTSVAGGHAEQVLGAASGTVPVFGEGDQVDVVPGERGTGDTGGTHPGGEDLPHGSAGGPGQMQGVEGVALGLGDRRGDGESGPDASQTGLAQQPRPRLDDLAEHLGGVGHDGDAARRGGHDPAAEPHERRAEAVGVHLGGEGDRSVVPDGQPVGGAAL